MRRCLLLTHESTAQLQKLTGSPAQAGLHKQVLKTLALLQHNIRHPGLKTHQYHSRWGKSGETVWEAYVQNNTPGLGVFFSTTAPMK